MDNDKSRQAAANGRSWAFFAAVLAVYPVLFIAVANSGQVPLLSVVGAAAAALLAAGLLLFATMRLLGDRAKSALLVACIAAFFYAYGPVHSLLEGRLLLSGDEGDERANVMAGYLHPALSTLWVVGLVVAFRAAGRIRPERAAALVRPLNLVALLLLAMLGIQAARAALGNSAPGLDGRVAEVGSLQTSVLGYNPDIYYIVLDGYARADVLETFYGFENSEFVDGLSARGFQVNASSYANYYWTFLSLASALNLDYVQNLAHGDGRIQTLDRRLLYEAVRNNAASQFLRARGYRFIHVRSSWGATLENPYADEEVSCYDGMFEDEYLRAIIESSWLKVLQSRVGADLAQCFLSNVSSVSALGQAPGPKFVLAHFLPPHHPYLFDADGNVLRNANISNQFEFQKKLWEKRDGYLGQLRFVNRQMVSLVDSIRASSPKPPIIIIHSDHGPMLSEGVSGEQQVRARLANFAAYLLPGATADLMPPDGSPVNQLRRVFNHYFQTTYSILPERYFASSFQQPTRFHEVINLRPAGEALAAPMAFQ